MNEDTSPQRTRAVPRQDTKPVRRRRTSAPAAAPEPPSPKRAARRRSSNRAWRIVAIVLGTAVGLNLCLTAGFWVYTNRLATTDMTPLAITAPPQVALLLTALPPLQPQQPTEEGPAAPGQATVAPLPTYIPAPTTGVVTILLLGIDERPNQAGEPTRSDTMIVLRADFDHHSARMMSFPRDMWVALPGLESYGITANRINTAYFFGERYELPGGGPRLAIDTLTLNFGLRIDHYALVNFAGFVNTVDALGGIDLDVPEEIYDDQFPTDDYGITLLYVPAGRQHLDGLTALRYARTRHQDSDFERARRQQAVLLAIRDKAISFNVVTKLPELISIAGESFRTDMNLPQMVTYAYGGQSIDRDKIESYVIDENYLVGWSGAGGASLYIPDREKIAPLIEQFLREE